MNQEGQRQHLETLVGKTLTDQLYSKYGVMNVILQLTEAEMRKAGASSYEVSMIQAAKGLSFGKIDQVRCSNDSYQYFKHLEHMKYLDHEQIWGLVLNSCNGVISMEKFHQGGISSSIVDVRVILKRMSILKAKGLIISHNHPSGNLKASPQDLSITKRIGYVLGEAGMKLLDHIIVGHNGYLSFADEGYSLRGLV